MLTSLSSLSSESFSRRHDADFSSSCLSRFRRRLPLAAAVCRRLCLRAAQPCAYAARRKRKCAVRDAYKRYARAREPRGARRRQQQAVLRRCACAACARADYHIRANAYVRGAAERRVRSARQRSPAARACACMRGGARCRSACRACRAL